MRRGIFQVPTADNYIRQGVTTLLGGLDGFSQVPLKPFLDKLEATPRSINIGSFVGHGSLRVKAMGYVDRAASEDEVAKMQALVDADMRDEGRHVVRSVEETIAVGEQGGLPTHVSHHKAAGKPSWGRR